MYLIVCLGNPGEQYINTRHNVGFMMALSIIDKFAFCKIGKKFSSIMYRGTIMNQDCLLIKPQTFMNLSGKAVFDVINFYKIPLTNLLVIYDDVDLPLGKIRIRQNGSAGTHNGMKSIVASLKSSEFSRIRVGIGPKSEEIPLDQFVLSNFKKNELDVVLLYQEQINNILLMIFQEGVAKAMSIYNFMI
ncbi:MAG: aminoacyl-tRNA hydrolase [Candidatus Margulisiibacteriota bacterium]|jgi:PTH1 family peptidyl-tRNA hydrolase